MYSQIGNDWFSAEWIGGGAAGEGRRGAEETKLIYTQKEISRNNIGLCVDVRDRTGGMARRRRRRGRVNKGCVLSKLCHLLLACNKCAEAEFESRPIAQSESVTRVVKWRPGLVLIICSWGLLGDAYACWLAWMAEKVIWYLSDVSFQVRKPTKAEHFFHLLVRIHSPSDSFKCL